MPSDKLVMVPNGVNTHNYDGNGDLKDFRSKFALPEEKIVLFVGRLVYEKGIHVLINAVPKILSKVNAKFIIVGSGYMKEQLLNIVRSMGLEHKVLFEGFMDEATLLKLQRCADVSVVPSLFEPFGIVALEAMAAQSPVVASDTGGLSEIIEHDVTGVKVYPNNPDSLAWGITKVLLDENYAKRLRDNAYKTSSGKVRLGKNRSANQAHIRGRFRRVLEEFLGLNCAKQQPIICKNDYITWYLFRLI